MCVGVGTAIQSMTESMSVVCQDIQSYILMYFVLVVIANCIFYSSVFLAAGEELLQHSTDALCQVYTNTDPEYNCF